SLPVATSHKRRLLSNIAVEIRVLPSGEKAGLMREVMPAACQRRISLPEAASNRTISPPQCPDARILPLGENATQFMEGAGALNFARSLRAATSQTLISPVPASLLGSWLVVARSVPSGEKLLNQRGSPRPCRVATFFPVATSHRQMVGSL